MKISEKTNVYCSKITFRIDVDFEGCDVDMIYNEMRAMGVQTIVPSLLVDFESKGGFGHKPRKFKLKGNSTPTEASVDFALKWLAGFVDRNNMCTVTSKFDTDYSKPMITEKSSDGVEYRVYPKVKTELEEIGVTVESWYGLMQGCCHLECEVDYEKFSPELILKSTEIVQNIISRFVKYYNPKNKKRELINN